VVDAGVVQQASIAPLATESKHSSGGIRAPGSKNLTSNLPPDMRSMSFEKRTPEVPRCGRLPANALCIFQWIVASWALALVVSSATDTVDANLKQNFETALDIFDLPLLKKR